ncbi:hypothetical protein Lal_00033050 [Lupinus albus]|nr:hypothetical protein Lal_00033050 [Lupinus albus]
MEYDFFLGKYDLGTASKILELATYIGAAEASPITTAPYGDSASNVDLYLKLPTRIRKECPFFVVCYFKAPQAGWIKINTDDAAHGSPDLAGGGCIFGDCTGNYRGGLGVYMRSPQ